MIGIDDILEGVLGGTSWGVGAIAIAAVAAIGAPRAKPLAKQAIKGYLAAAERVREMAAEATEQIQDIYAEAKYEYESQLNGEDGEVESGDEAPAPASRSRRRPSTTGLVTPAGEPV